MMDSGVVVVMIDFTSIELPFSTTLEFEFG